MKTRSRGALLLDKKGFGFRVIGFRVSGLGFGVWGLVFRVV